MGGVVREVTHPPGDEQPKFNTEKSFVMKRGILLKGLQIVGVWNEVGQLTDSTRDVLIVEPGRKSGCRDIASDIMSGPGRTEPDRTDNCDGDAASQCGSGSDRSQGETDADLSEITTHKSRVSLSTLLGKNGHTCKSPLVNILSERGSCSPRMQKKKKKKKKRKKTEITETDFADIFNLAETHCLLSDYFIQIRLAFLYSCGTQRFVSYEEDRKARESTGLEILIYSESNKSRICVFQLFAFPMPLQSKVTLEQLIRMSSICLSRLLSDCLTHESFSAVEISEFPETESAECEEHCFSDVKSARRLGTKPIETLEKNRGIYLYVLDLLHPFQVRSLGLSQEERSIPYPPTHLLKHEAGLHSSLLMHDSYERPGPGSSSHPQRDVKVYRTDETHLALCNVEFSTIASTPGDLAPGDVVTNPTVSIHGDVVPSDVESSTIVPSVSTPGDLVPGNVVTNPTVSVHGDLVPSDVVTSPSVSTPEDFVPGDVVTSPSVSTPGDLVPGDVVTSPSVSTPEDFVPGDVVTSPSVSTPGDLVPGDVVTSPSVSTPGDFVPGDVVTSPSLSTLEDLVPGDVVTSPSLSTPEDLVPGDVVTSPSVSTPEDFVPGDVVTSPSVSTPGDLVPGDVVTSPSVSTPEDFVPGDVVTSPSVSTPGDLVPGDVVTSPSVSTPGDFVPGDVVTSPSLSTLEDLVPGDVVTSPSASTPEDLVPGDVVTSPSVSTPGDLVPGDVVTSPSVSTPEDLVPGDVVTSPSVSTPEDLVPGDVVTSPSVSTPEDLVPGDVVTSPSVSTPEDPVPGDVETRGTTEHSNSVTYRPRHSRELRSSVANCSLSKDRSAPWGKGKLVVDHKQARRGGGGDLGQISRATVKEELVKSSSSPLEACKELQRYGSDPEQAVPSGLPPSLLKKKEDKGEEIEDVFRNMPSSASPLKNPEGKGKETEEAYRKHGDSDLSWMLSVSRLPPGSRDAIVAMLRSPQQGRKQGLAVLDPIHSGMENEWNRLATFTGFIPPGGVFILPVAAAGFFLPSQEGQGQGQAEAATRVVVVVECAFCGVTVDMARFARRDAKEVHREASGSCRFVSSSRQAQSLSAAGNVSVSQITEQSASLFLRDMSSGPESAAALSPAPAASRLPGQLTDLAADAEGTPTAAGPSFSLPAAATATATATFQQNLPTLKGLAANSNSTLPPSSRSEESARSAPAVPSSTAPSSSSSSSSSSSLSTPSSQQGSITAAASSSSSQDSRRSAAVADASSSSQAGNNSGSTGPAAQQQQQTAAAAQAPAQTGRSGNAAAAAAVSSEASVVTNSVSGGTARPEPAHSPPPEQQSSPPAGQAPREGGGESGGSNEWGGADTGGESGGGGRDVEGRAENRQLVTYDDLGIFTQMPKRPDMVVKAIRINTFENWPHRSTHPPAEMAEAGFYYTGHADLVRCFHCKGGLKTWESSDKPWVEHSRWFPRCPFVRLYKGQKFVDAVQKLNNPETRPTITEEQIEREIKRMEEEERRNVGSDVVLFSTSTPPAPEDDGTLGPLARTALRINADVAPGTLTDMAEQLAEENEEMRDHVRCKMCQMSNVSVLFLPCGHLVACAQCAPALRRCAICRHDVKGYVHVHMDYDLPNNTWSQGDQGPGSPDAPAPALAPAPSQPSS
ncbi:uncharacterized protein LOC143283006 isoform X2 [Babylonia areolata]|uniref:uncharacterized protein LOC143283006 isoform X2 n=1 Tax=Babylonia areolata TaxID=304850 RepID=UPI003FCF6B89